MMNGDGEHVDKLTVCPTVDDAEWFKHRPNGAGIAVYNKLVKAGFPEGWTVLCLNCYRKRRDEILRKDREISGK